MHKNLTILIISLLAIWNTSIAEQTTSASVMVVHNASAFYADKDVMCVKGMALVTTSKRPAKAIIKEFLDARNVKRVVIKKRKPAVNKRVISKNKSDEDVTPRATTKQNRVSPWLFSKSFPASPSNTFCGERGGNMALLPTTNTSSNGGGKIFIKKYIKTHLGNVHSWTIQKEYQSCIASRLYNQLYVNDITARPPPTC